VLNRRVIGSLVLVVGAQVGLVAPAAQACACHFTDITVRSSDPTPRSGQTFRIRGRFVDSGDPARNQLVRVQAHRNRHWVALPGARVRTHADGGYRMRLILSQRGERLLRVVGMDQGPGPNAYERFSVRVH
jgi:hypothetical protein